MKIVLWPWVTVVMVLATTTAFSVVSTKTSFHRSAAVTSVNPPVSANPLHRSSSAARHNSAAGVGPLFVLVDVPDYFFTATFFIASIFLQVMRKINRSRMEELAWEQRLEEARERRMEEDPTLMESDLFKKEAAKEWSAYGPEAMARRARRRRVAVAEREEEEDDEDDEYRRAATDMGMSDDEIAAFETEFGIDYDPYYDDPYTEEELPEDMKYRVSRPYGDRIYEDGEVFYKDEKTGMYYRQGSRPRIQKLF